MEVSILESLCFSNCKITTREAALSYLVDRLYEQGFVSNEYKEKLLNREKEYPTGLNSLNPKVAIPHTDYEFVNKSALGIMTLVNEVDFANMENPNETIGIRIIVMMALDTPNGQVEMLQHIMQIVQDQEVKNMMLNAKTDAELCQVVKKAFH